MRGNSHAQFWNGGGESDLSTHRNDLEKHRVVDLLENRTAASLASWLREHKGVEVIARDRAGAYADGARQGAPGAIQEADRFHLLVNAGEALERVLARKHPRLREAATAIDRLNAEKQQTTTVDMDRIANGGTPKPATFAERERHAQRNRRQARDDGVRELADHGWGIWTIARHWGMGRKTVRRLLRAKSLPEPVPLRRRPSILDPHIAFLADRWVDGCHNAHALWTQLAARGFTGSPGLVRRLVAHPVTTGWIVRSNCSEARRASHTELSLTTRPAMVPMKLVPTRELPSMIDRSHDARNTAARERLRVLVSRLDDADLARPLGEGWTVAVALAHLAAWDRSALAVLESWRQTGVWPAFAGAAAINAAELPTWQTVPHRDAARQAVEAAEEVDARIRALPDSATVFVLRENPRLLDRSHHRRAHLDEIESALATTKQRPDE